MKQMNIKEELKVDFNYNGPNVPGTVKALRPLVYQEGGAFHCVLGPDTQTGVYGTGNTAEEATMQWAAILDQRATICELDKETGHFILEKLSAINQDKGEDTIKPS